MTGGEIALLREQDKLSDDVLVTIPLRSLWRAAEDAEAHMPTFKMNIQALMVQEPSNKHPSSAFEHAKEAALQRVSIMTETAHSMGQSSEDREG